MEILKNILGKKLYLSIFLSFFLLCTSVVLSEPEWITFPGGSGVNER